MHALASAARLSPEPASRQSPATRRRRAGELLKKGNGMYQVQCATGSAAQASQATPQRKRRAP